MVYFERCISLLFNGPSKYVSLMQRSILITCDTFFTAFFLFYTSFYKYNRLQTARKKGVNTIKLFRFKSTGECLTKKGNMFSVLLFHEPLNLICWWEGGETFLEDGRRILSSLPQSLAVIHNPVPSSMTFYK